VTGLSVSQLLTGDLPAAHVVARRHGQALTLGRLRAEVARVSQEIQARRARRGLLVCSDSFQFLVGMLGLMAAGAEIVLPPNARPGTLAGLTGLFDVLVSDDVPVAGVESLALDGSSSDAAIAPIVAAQARLDFFTSGSTGQAKRIEKTLAMLEREAATLHSVFGAQVGLSVTTGTVTHQHIYGLAFRVMWPLLSGRAFSSPVHDTWEGLLADLPAGAAIIASPAHLSRLAGLAPLAASQRPSLVLTAGGPLPDAAATDARAIFGIAPTEVFGSTETGALAYKDAPERDALWRAMPGIEVATSANGLLQVRSPYVTGGFCELADKATIAGDGRFQFEGRADRIVKIEGRRVSLPGLEQAIRRLRWVSDAAVATVPPANTALGAIVVLTAEGAAALAQQGKFRFERMLRRELAATHEPASLPRRWRFVSEIPADGMGKRRQRDLAQLLSPEPSA
jgi:acyl-coenzyme A synthetase/AMP-(fatty) acid ligase